MDHHRRFSREGLHHLREAFRFKNHTNTKSSSDQDDKIEKTKKSDENTLSPFRAYIRLWTYANPLDNVLRAVGCVAALGAGTAYPLMTIIFGSLINDFNNFGLRLLTPPEFRSRLNTNSLWFVYLFLGKFGLIYIADYLLCFTATRMARRIRLQYLKTMLYQSVSYFDEHPPGSIATSLSTDTNMIEVGLADKVASLCQGCGMIISAFGIGFAKSWRLTLVVGTTIPYMILITGLLGSIDARLEGKQKKIYSQAATIAEEAMSSILSITALGAKDRIVEKFMGPVKLASSYTPKYGPIQASIYGNMFFSMQAGYALALYYGVHLLSHGNVRDGGTVINVLFCMLMGTSAMGIIAPSMPNFIQAATSAQQVLKLLDRKETFTSEDTSKIQLVNQSWELKFKDVAFSYPKRPSVTILDLVSFEIPAGKVTAIVGQSGSGKSTIISLLERWYIPQDGLITLNDIDITEFDLNWLRGNIGLVQQDPILFNDTILENVLNGLEGGYRGTLSDEQKRKLVIDACLQANAHEFIMQLPHKYDTNVGERANLLSGGQKQRIAIARSIISNPKILLLDEATASLDYESEQAVQKALDNASRGRTTLVISHKLSMIQGADNIIVIDQGKVVEQGAHAALLSQGGIYRQLFQAQELETHDVSDKDVVDFERVGSEPGEKSNLRLDSHQLEGTTEVKALSSKDISRKFSLIRCVFTILSETRSLLPTFFGGTIGSIIAGLCIPAQAYLFSKLVTVFQLRGSPLINRGNFWALMFFVLALTNLISYAILWFLFSLAAAKVSRKYRAGYLRGILSQDISFFEISENASGALAALLATDGDTLESFFGMSLALLLVFCIDILACCIVAIALGWKLGLVGVLGCYPILFLAGFFRMRMDTTAQDRCAENFLESARFGAEAVDAIRTVSSLTLEEKVVERYGDKLRKAVLRSAKRTMISTIAFALSDCVDFLAVGLVFWYGGRLVSFGELSVSTYFIIYTAIIFGGQGAGFIFGYSGSMSKSQSSANRIIHMQRLRAPINSSTGITPNKLHKDEPSIEFRDVHFRYPGRPDVKVLKGIDFKIYAGENISIVGPSGCGKSTIVSLIERFYDISSGEIFIRGTPISKLDIAGFRATLGLVSQETSLYDGTIRQNLCLGVDKAIDDATLIQACRDANIHDFISSLPDGYGTECGHGGLALSGGQRQRMAIARALLRNPSILLLDEATSALDPESRNLVVDALEKAGKGRTMISITHQEEIMRRADKVLVIERGKVVEIGTYEGLMAQKGWFWEMRGKLVDG